MKKRTRKDVISGRLSRRSVARKEEIRQLVKEMLAVKTNVLSKAS